MRTRLELDCAPEELRGRIEAYFARCEGEGRMPTVAGLCLQLRISPAEFMAAVRAFDSPEEPRGFTREHARELLMAQLRICDIVEQGRDSMSIFRLKQPLYSGCLEGADADTEISVTLSGAVGDAWE